MKRVALTLAFVVGCIIINAQVPQGFNYQAIARNSSGEPIANTTLQVKIAILSDTLPVVVVREELHSSVKTNAFGIFSLVVGTEPWSDGPVTNFEDIDWKATPLFIRTQIFYDGEWKNMGSAQLWSVPYSMVAGDMGGSVKNLEVMGEDETSDEALFEVKRKDGELMFGVYNHGVRINMPLDTISKTRKGGFIVAGFDNTKGIVQDYFVVNPDSIRAYIDTNPIKTRKGGFAIGGFGTIKQGEQKYLFVSGDSIRAYIDTTSTKAVKGGFAIGGFVYNKSSGEEYLRVTRDSTRIYLKNTGSKAVKGGFAIGGFGTTKGDIKNFLDLTPRNYFIGHNSGRAITSGLYNSAIGYESGLNVSLGESNAFMGYQAGYNNTSGSSNLFLGYKSGYSNTEGNYNTFVGYNAGYSNNSGLNNTFLGSSTGQNNSIGNYNIFIGDSSGFNNTIGDDNSFVGTKTGFHNVNGWKNAFIGNYTGYANVNGCENVFIGNSSGYSNISAGGSVNIGNRSGYFGTNGWNNVFIGTETGYNNIDGAGNVYIGYQAGVNNRHGTRNIFIGNRAGRDQLGSGILIIDNNEADSCDAFIWGDMQGGQLRLNSRVGIGTISYQYDLSIFKDGRATINLKGSGDLIKYAALTLESDNTPGSNTYMISHAVNHLFEIEYFNGTSWFNRINIDTQGKVAINNNETGTEMLDVNVNARFRSVGSGTFAYDLNITNDGTLTTSTSDISMKKNIYQIQGALESVLKMRGIYFNWKDDTTGIRQIGMIAQEVEPIVPEVVFTNPVDGLKGINYSQTTALLVEAIKEQQQQIESYKSENDNLKSRLQTLQQEVEQIKAFLATSGGK